MSNASKSKKSMFIKKTIDYTIPKNIMTLISKWIDCYNDTIMEKTKIKMHYDFESKINDTDLMASSKKMSNSSKRSENERIKYEKEIFIWLSMLSDTDLDFYSDKISVYMNMNKEMMIKNYINPIRIENKSFLIPTKNSFIPIKSNTSSSSNKSKDSENYETSSSQNSVSKNVSQNTSKNENSQGNVSNVKILYGDAWDL